MVRAVFALFATFAFAGTSAAGEKVTAAADELRETQELAGYIVAPVFDMLDCTDQGFIESGEVDEHFPLLFNHYDRNLDSSLALGEFLGASDGREAELKRRMFADMDRNGNERVSPREYRDGVIALIRATDNNSDGEVTMVELTGVEPSEKADEDPEEAE